MPNNELEGYRGNKQLKLPNTKEGASMDKNILNLAAKGLAALILWLCAYASVAPLAHWLTYGLLGLGQSSPFGHALEFFLYDAPKILLLLVFMVYVIGWLRAGLNTDRVRDYLKGKKRSFGYALGAVFGAITPFCSCSSIPLFLGFTTARIPLSSRDFFG